MNKVLRFLSLWGVLCFGLAKGQVTCGNSQYVPNPDDCGSYYECSNGKPYLMHCPADEVYSPTLATCTNSEAGECSTAAAGSSNKTTEAPTSTVTISGQVPNYYCPDVDGSSAYLYPNPVSCSSFYMCNGGKLVIFQCPQSLYYSVADRVCVYPFLAKCDLNNLPTFPNGPTAAPSCQATTTNNPITAISPGPVPNYYCPEVDGIVNYMYPSPYSCSSYYMCAEGKLYLIQCPSGLEYSATHQVCLFPSSAQCDLSHLPTYPTGPTGLIPTASPTTAISTGSAPNYYCPVVDGSNSYIYPSPYSCSYFYMCHDGQLNLIQCPGGLEYSITERLCLYPTVAKCDINNLPTYPTGHTTTVTTPIASQNPIPDYYCPEIDSSTPYMYPSPYNCSDYYQCVGGKLQLYRCQNGLQYSVTERGCDYPSVAKCDLNNLPTFPSGPTNEVITQTTTPFTVPSQTTGGSGHDVTENFYCPPNESGTYYRYPTDCHMFYECNYGVVEIQTCPSGLLFSQSKQSCDYSENVPECSSVNNATTTAVPTTSGSLFPIPNYYCPEIDSSTPYMYPSPYNCSDYYQCVGGKLQLYRCQNGLQYSVTERGCDDPSVAQCDLNNLPTFPSGPTNEVITLTTTPYTVPSQTTGGSGHDVTVNFYCPPNESGTYYRYPTDCHMFYECNYGVVEIQTCPSGLLFSQSKQSCDYSENVPECSSVNNATTTAVPTTSGSLFPIPNYYCPEIDSSTPYMYPSPYNCSDYYQCVGGKLQLYRCQNGLQYSVTERGCDDPSVAKCDLNNLPTFPSGPTNEVITLTTTPYTVPSQTTGGSGHDVTVNFYCPPNESGTYYRYPTDCHMFYECNYGVVEIQTCPSGLLFSQSKQSCDYSENVPECSSVNNATTTAVPTTSGSLFPIPNYYCPEIDSSTPYMYPSPYNCSDYYQCVGGKLQLYRCQNGLQYSVTERGCDDPSVAQCDLNNLPTFPSGPTNEVITLTTTPYTVPSQTTGGSGHDVTVNFYCPPNESGTYYRYPTDCHMFYECNYGVVEIQTCPSGLLFSQSKQSCDYSENVPECSSVNNATTTAVPTTSGSLFPIPNYYCPEIDSSTPYMYPSPYNCSDYYQCVGGKLQLYRCQNGLQYSVTERGCDDPSVAQCDLNNLPTFPSGPTNEVITQTTTPFTVPSQTTGGSGHDVTENFYCPPNESGTYYRYPTDCHMFYECNYGVVEIQTCPSGLLFSQSKQSCDYSENVPECSSVNNATTTAVPTTSGSLFPIPNYYCPEIDSSTPYMYPSPYNCSDYYQCVGGKLQLYRCQNGLQYSVTERGCDDPSVAQCDLNNLPTFPSGPTNEVITLTTTPYTVPSQTTGGSGHDVTVNFYCPPNESGTYYRYPTDCHMFYECNYGVVEIQTCPSGLLFSQSKQSCDYSENVPECSSVNNATTTAVPTTSGSLFPIPNYYCPEIDSSTPYMYPSPYNCSDYYQCVGGKLQLYRCQNGLQYSVTERGCDDPSVAKCDLNNLPTFPSGPTNEVITLTTTPYTVPSQTTGGSGHDVTVNFYCPPNESGTYYRYPTDCHMFYECNYGVVEIQTCPSGLLFSQSKQSCDYSENVPECSSVNNATTTAVPTTSGSLFPIPNYYCPEIDSSTPYMYPSPYNCSDYYQCVGGKLQLYRCQNGLQYSVTERGCDDPSVAQCDLNNLPTFPSGPTNEVITLTTTPYTVPSQTTGGSGHDVTVNFYCPPNESGTYYRYPTDCHMFYECNYGVVEIQTCPSGLLFSQSKQSCDYSENVPECSSVNNATTTTAVPTTSGSLFPIPNYYCPEIDSSTPYMYPSPYNCSDYYQCVGGKLQLYRCQNGLQYSVTERGCDDPSVAKCDLNNLPTFPLGPTTQITVPQTTTVNPQIASATHIPSTVTAGSEEDVTVHYECPPNESGTYYRYPTDCHKFFECNYGVAEVQTCPSGLLFSQSKTMCDYSENVPECSTTTQS